MASFAGYDIADPDTSADATPSPAPAATASPQSFGGYDLAPDTPAPARPFSVSRDIFNAKKHAPNSSPLRVDPTGEVVSPMSSGDLTPTNIVRTLTSGVPIIGGLLNKMDAATNAALAPALNQFFDPEDRLKGNTFGERYRRSLAIQNGLDAGFSFLNPTLSKVGNTAGAIASTVPAIAAAPVAFGAEGGSLLGRTALSALSGGGINAADTAIRGGSLPEIERAGTLGTVLGAVAPAAGDLVGGTLATSGRMATGVSPGVENVARIMHETGFTPMQAEARLAQLGPYGTLADVAPAFQDEAGGLASMGGAPTQILKSAMLARAAGKDTRVSDTVAQTIGPRPDLTAEQEGIQQAAHNAASPYYNAARANPTPMDSTSVLNDIDAKLAKAPQGSAEAAILAKAKGYLTDQKVGMVGPDGKPTMMVVPKSDPDALLKARQALDDDIEGMKNRGLLDGTTAGKSAINSARDIRGGLDDILKSDDNIAAGDAAYSTKISERNALDEGTELFKPGTRIEDVKRSITGKNPEQIGAMQKGALSALHDRLDGVSGDWSAARQMFGKSDANRQKLDALFPGAQDLFDNIEAELSMRQTEQNVAAGSQTASRRAIQEKYAPENKTGTGGILPAITAATTVGAPGVVASEVGRSALNNVRTASRAKLINQTASALATPQSEISPLMQQVTRAFYAQPKISALSSGGNALTNATVRNQVPEVPSWVLPNSGLSALQSLVGLK